MKAERIPTLDGWRALAALAIVVMHFSANFASSHAVFMRESPLHFGLYGVDFFFGLSGMLITKLLLDELEASGDISLRRFYVRRAFRILPACLVYVIVVTAAGLLKSNPELVTSLLFVRNYLPDQMGSAFTTHLWSLGVEAHFYFLWPALLLWAGRKNGSTAASYLAIACALWHVLNAQYATLAAALPNVVPLYRTDFRLDALLWGCVVGFLLQDRGTKEKLGRQLSAGVAIGMAAVFCVFVYYGTTLMVLMTPVLIPLIIASTVAHPEWAVSRFLEWAPLRWVGRISFSLYLWQQLIYLLQPEHGLHGPGAAALVILTVLCGSILSYYFVEQKMISVGRIWSRRIGSGADRPVIEVKPATL